MSKASRGSKQIRSVSKQRNGRASGQVLTSHLMVVLNHGAALAAADAAAVVAVEDDEEVEGGEGDREKTKKKKKKKRKRKRKRRRSTIIVKPSKHKRTTLNPYDCHLPEGLSVCGLVCPSVGHTLLFRCAVASL